MSGSASTSSRVAEAASRAEGDAAPIDYSGPIYEQVEACPFCGSTDHAQTLRVERTPTNASRFAPGRLGGRLVRFTARQCASCGLVFQGPRPPEDLLMRIIDDAYPVREPTPRLTALFERDLRLLAKHAAPGGRLLDVGCNAGYFLELARDRYEVFGCDPCGPAVERAQERVGADRVVHGRITDCEGGFDVITSLDTFEHMYDPGEFVQRVAERLNPGGVFFVRTLRRDGTNAKRCGTNWHGYTVWHLIYPTMQEVHALCARAGLEPVRSVVGRAGVGEGWVSLKHHAKMLGGKRLPIGAWRDYRKQAEGWARHWSFFRDEFTLIAKKPGGGAT